MVGLAVGTCSGFEEVLLKEAKIELVKNQGDQHPLNRQSLSQNHDKKESS